MTRPPRRPRRKARKARRKAVAMARKPTRRTKPGGPDAMDAFIADGARMLDLKIKQAWMPAVRDQLAVTLRHGAQVMGFALPDDSEPAPVYEP
jgi:hypothetical protein